MPAFMVGVIFLLFVFIKQVHKMTQATDRLSASLAALTTADSALIAFAASAVETENTVNALAEAVDAEVVRIQAAVPAA